MNEVDHNLFAKIPTELFYHVINNPIKDNNISSKDNSILTNIRDDKVLLIIYYLYISTNYMQEANVSISYLINKCNYYNNDKAKSEFRIILNDLCKLKYISIDENINKLKHNDLFIVNTDNIFNSEQFVILEQKELNTLIVNTSNKKELLNLLKVYLYLKCRCYKKMEGDYTAKSGGKAQVTYCSYNNIASYTYTSESYIAEYIIKLKELNLIDYKNLGKKYNINDPKKKLTDCNNVYTIMSVCSGELSENELAEGLKQQQQFYEDNDFAIVKTKTNNTNDKAIYGRKGYLVRKANNNTITEKEQIELELISTDVEEYKIKYKKKKQTKQ